MIVEVLFPFMLGWALRDKYKYKFPHETMYYIDIVILRAGKARSTLTIAHTQAKPDTVRLYQLFDQISGLVSREHVAQLPQVTYGYIQPWHWASCLWFYGSTASDM